MPTNTCSFGDQGSIALNLIAVGGHGTCLLLFGVRYVDYEENYLFLSDTARGLGSFQSNATNRMVGAQIGADVLYPVSLPA